MNQPNKDYTPRGRAALLALVGVLVALSFIPPQNVGGVELRRANILSEILSFDDAVAETPSEPELFDEEEFTIDLDEVSEQVEAAVVAVPEHIQKSYAWSVDSLYTAERTKVEADTALLRHTTTPIEDFSKDSRMEAFYDTLLNAKRPVRIAFMGDSFVEGDILTQDLREKLQETYGGGGAGFAPTASPLTGFRRTIKTHSKGWTAYNVMQQKKTPEALRNNFYVSGWVCAPAVDASTRWEVTASKKHLDACTTARLLFLSPSASRIEVVVNDSLKREFRIDADSSVREIAVSAPRIGSVAMTVREGVEGFTGYGAVFEHPGVVVDNYSIRSNNGQAMFRTNARINAQINELMPYDLIILQYGLNIMQQGVHLYGNYARQIEKMVAYVRQCFPQAAVLVLGVSDRSVKGEAGFEPMDAIPHMLRFQREAAENTGAAFWSTADAMRSLGGMAAFVANGWAGKDYTHINFAGGRQVAYQLFNAIDSGVRHHYNRILIEEQQRRAEQMRIDSLEMLMPVADIALPRQGVEISLND